MEKFWIDPPDRKCGGRKYPWRDLQVGDSFFVTAKGESVDHLRKRMGSISRTLTRVSPFLKGMKFATEKVDEYGIAGVIVRRVL